MVAALGRDEHEYSAVDNYNVWILTFIYAGLLLAAVQQMLVSVTQGNSRKSFHFVFLAITAAWLPLRLFIFFATQEDVSTWPEIIWLLPTSIQFCGFALWVLFFADVTAVRATGVIGGIATRMASGPRSPVLNKKGLASLAKHHGGGSALATPFLSGRAGAGGNPTSPLSRGGGSFGEAEASVGYGYGYGYGGSALSSVDDDDDDDGMALGGSQRFRLCICCGCGVRRLRPAEFVYAWSTIILMLFNAVEIGLTLVQAQVASESFEKAVSMAQHIFNGAVHLALALPLSRLIFRLCRSARGSLAAHLPRSPRTLALLGLTLTIIFASRVGYNVSVAAGLGALPPFPPIVLAHTGFMVSFEALPLALALASVHR